LLEVARILDGGRIPGQRGGVKAGHWHWGAADMARAPIQAVCIPPARTALFDLTLLSSLTAP
jgi:hypothetical protein